ncbi:Kallikrein-7 [Manis javanica]|nr:Kallikrein-7 [Manis javanica]
MSFILGDVQTQVARKGHFGELSLDTLANNGNGGGHSGWRRYKTAAFPGLETFGSLLCLEQGSDQALRSPSGTELSSVWQPPERLREATMAGHLFLPLLILLLSLVLGSAGQEAQDDKSGEKIINGVPCPRGSQPWQVALLNGNQLHCGGVLLNQWWVLTAAHCMMSQYNVHMGSDSLSDAMGQNIRATKSFRHPGYSTKTHVNDIMLVKLSRPARLSPSVRKVNLPSRCDPPGTTCTVSGWGTTTSPAGDFPNTIQCAYVHLVPRAECEHDYPGQITQNMVCAGDEKYGRDSCQGDSGGPLVCGDRLRGLVSWGSIPCGSKEKPGVYTDVCRYGHWIQKTIQRSGHKSGET